MTKIAMADDHILLRNALGNLIDTFGHFKVTLMANNGQELIRHLNEQNKPDILLLDLNMPLMDGFETAAWFREHYPDVHILMLTMYDAEATLIRLLQMGVKGFLKKDIHPNELKLALETVIQVGYYYSYDTTGRILNLFRNMNDQALQRNLLSDQEVEFLKLAASDKTYKEIAMDMSLNPRAVDNLRDHLFEKLEVRSRVGLAMYAIKKGLVRI